MKEKKYYDLGDEESIIRIIQNILDNFDSSDSADIAGADIMEQIPTKENRGYNGRLELPKGITLEDFRRNKDLVVTHNLSENKLLETNELEILSTLVLIRFFLLCIVNSRLIITYCMQIGIFCIKKALSQR